jgi:uncharacterized protein (DUF1684 family)
MTTPSAYSAEIADWQAKRFAHLTAEDGWLNVIGRYWLEPGSASVGSADDNDIILSAGPAHVGTITQDDAGGVSFLAIEPGAAPVQLEIGAQPPPRFSVGSLLFEVTTMDGRHALRARDRNAAARINFAGLDYFPTTPGWRVVARKAKLAEPIELDIDTVSGIPTKVLVTYRAEFEHAGKTFALLPTHGTAEKPQFVLRDLTSKTETYGASRFLYGEDVGEETLVLDFNKAFNPPCAFTEHAVCPLPPPGNVLPIRIEAGEKRPADH